MKFYPLTWVKQKKKAGISGLFNRFFEINSLASWHLELLKF